MTQGGPDSGAAQKAVDLIDKLMRARKVSPRAQPHYPVALLVCAQSKEFDTLDAAADAAVAVAERMADDSGDDDEPGQFAFSESDHPRAKDGKFTSGDDENVETPDFTAPGATAPRGGVRGKVEGAVAAVREKGVAGAGLSALKGTIAGVSRIADTPAAPLEKAGYSKRTAKAIAVTAAVLAGTPLSFGLLGAAIGVLPAAAAAIPGAVEAGIVLGGAMGLKDPLGTARKALAVVRALPGKIKARGEKRRNQREALASLTAEHAPRAAASVAPATQYADAKRNIIWRDAYRDDVSDGMWRVPGVPVFCVVPSGTKARPDGSYDDDDGVDRSTLERMAAHANQRAKVGHYRALHLGHQKNHPDGRPDLSGDQPLLAFCENWRVEDTSWGPVLHCDLWGIEERDIEQFERGRYPFLSVEAGADEVVSIAVMQSRPPHFEFPNLWIKRRETKPAVARHAADTRLARQFAADYRKQHAQEARMDEKNDKLPPVPFADDGDDKDDDKDEADQYAAPPGAAPGAPAAAPEPTMNDVMALLKQIAASLKPAAPAAPAAPAPVQHASVPDTMRPLEPASASKFALDPADRAALDTVRQYAAQIAHDKAKKSVIAEARGAASRDELAVLEGMADKSPEVARQFASYLRTRGPVQTGPATVTAVSVPVSIIGAAIKQFAADTGRQVDEHDQRALAIAQQARTDWLDTTRDEGPDGKVFRQQFAGEAGCRKWIALNLARALPKRIG